MQDFGNTASEMRRGLIAWFREHGDEDMALSIELNTRAMRDAQKNQLSWWKHAFVPRIELDSPIRPRVGDQTNGHHYWITQAPSGPNLTEACQYVERITAQRMSKTDVINLLHIALGKKW